MKTKNTEESLKQVAAWLKKDTIDLDIHIKSIPHNTHRYSTVGDFFYDDDTTLQIHVSKMGNRNMEFLVALHELCEVFFTEHKGIKEPDIKAFDEEFEKNRKPGNEDEPGNDPKAPYLEQHVLAEAIERIAATYLNVNWVEYNNKVMSL